MWRSQNQNVKGPHITRQHPPTFTFRQHPPFFFPRSLSFRFPYALRRYVDSVCLAQEHQHACQAKNYRRT